MVVKLIEGLWVIGCALHLSLIVYFKVCPRHSIWSLAKSTSAKPLAAATQRRGLTVNQQRPYCQTMTWCHDKSASDMSGVSLGMVSVLGLILVAWQARAPCQLRCLKRLGQWHHHPRHHHHRHSLMMLFNDWWWCLLFALANLILWLWYSGWGLCI